MQFIRQRSGTKSVITDRWFFFSPSVSEETNHQMDNNAESFSAIAAALDDLDQFVTALDENARNVIKTQGAIASLESDAADLRSNKAGLDQKVRGRRLTEVMGLLAIEQADLTTLTAEGDAQRDQVVQAVERAKFLLQETWSALLKLRKENVVNHLLRDFDTSKFFAPVEVLAAASRSVIEVDELQWLLFQHRMHDETILAIYDARLLRERSAGLVAMSKDEPALELSLTDPPVKPIPNLSRHVQPLTISEHWRSR